jgi:hypothetical protein
MKKSLLFILLGSALLMLSLNLPSTACTNFLISKGASKDGSTMITYSADSHVLYGELYYTPARSHLPGSMLDIYEWDTGKYLGQISQVAWTYRVVGNMNEYQVSIGETTWGGRRELRDPKAIMDYGSLMYIALQRARTAREAIEIMGNLMAEYGYYSSKGQTTRVLYGLPAKFRMDISVPMQTRPGSLSFPSTIRRTAYMPKISSPLPGKRNISKVKIRISVS